MVLRPGYPLECGLEIKSYRGGNSISKNDVESCIRAIRVTAQECLENGEEACLSCCMAAMSAWQDCADETRQLEQIKQNEADECRRLCEISRVKEDAADIEWISGGILVDRKSTFQAHIARIVCEDDVNRALDKLRSNTKISRATHNMYAYRFTEIIKDGEAEKKVLKHDNDDDGEDCAGSRMAQLLAMRGDDGVLVVVSRWSGGVKLGPKRFAHITNVARELLEQCEDGGLLEKRAN
eukprot:CAMPEP_0171297628 /NCGR_PEP_ID=MMETSP0816-20121228/6370_1 /TAXON_ID=420281 /ORGANISM="Proboscia inermis, Strain CCAP1064/1" /LENGTH=237 /DNA_ID=CAMNT_0011772031 /DNA_START=91 /DNA_END=804 /DNA_ORIENTATION=+